MVADLVLEGGGVKGNALVGAVAAFEEAGYRFHRIAGTSAGALVASMVAAGIPAARMQEHMLALDYTRFRDPTPLERLHLSGVGVALAELFDEGLYRGDALHEAVVEELRAAGVASFGDLRLDDPGIDQSVPADARFRLVVVASDITRQRMVRIPWDVRDEYGIDPHGMSVADAVRMSAAIPFYYVPAKLRSLLTGQESYMVDGGLVSGFPVSIFDRTDGRPPRWPTFRVSLNTALPPTQRAPELSGAMDMVRAVVHTGLHGRVNAERGEPAVASRTVSVGTAYVGTTDFSIDRATRRRLFDDGYAAAREFLARVTG